MWGPCSQPSYPVLSCALSRLKFTGKRPLCHCPSTQTPIPPSPLHPHTSGSFSYKFRDPAQKLTLTFLSASPSASSPSRSRPQLLLEHVSTRREVGHLRDLMHEVLCHVRPPATAAAAASSAVTATVAQLCGRLRGVNAARTDDSAAAGHLRCGETPAAAAKHIRGKSEADPDGAHAAGGGLEAEVSTAAGLSGRLSNPWAVRLVEDCSATQGPRIIALSSRVGPDCPAAGSAICVVSSGSCITPVEARSQGDAFHASGIGDSGMDDDDNEALANHQGNAVADCSMPVQTRQGPCPSRDDAEGRNSKADEAAAPSTHPAGATDTPIPNRSALGGSDLACWVMSAGRVAPSLEVDAGSEPVAAQSVDCASPVCCRGLPGLPRHELSRRVGRRDAASSSRSSRVGPGEARGQGTIAAATVTHVAAIHVLAQPVPHPAETTDKRLQEATIRGAMTRATGTGKPGERQGSTEEGGPQASRHYRAGPPLVGSASATPTALSEPVLAFATEGQSGGVEGGLYPEEFAGQSCRVVVPAVAMRSVQRGPSPWRRRSSSRRADGDWSASGGRMARSESLDMMPLPRHRSAAGGPGLPVQYMAGHGSWRDGLAEESESIVRTGSDWAQHCDMLTEGTLACHPSLQRWDL